jgi:hypothetical protein
LFDSWDGLVQKLSTLGLDVPVFDSVDDLVGPRNLSNARIAWSFVILLALLFSKFVYLACLRTYYTFYFIGKFHLPQNAANVRLFVFLGAVAAGTLIGGPVGDRMAGRMSFGARSSASFRSR